MKQKMSEEELREKIANIVYISRWVGKVRGKRKGYSRRENVSDGLVAPLTPNEYQEIEDKLVLLFNETNQSKDENNNYKF